MAELGPPFGGITRIRFKGFVYDVSAIRLPRTFTRSYGSRSRSQRVKARSALPAPSLFFRFHIRVKNGHPRALLLFPDGPRIVSTGGVLAIERSEERRVGSECGGRG